VPQGFEKISESLVDKYGILGLSAFRNELGMGGERDPTELKVALMSCGVKLSRENFSQVLAFLTRGDSFPADKIFQILSPVSDEFDSEAVGKKFDDYFGSVGVASIQEVAELYPELEHALLQFLDVYSSNNGISAADFMVLHSDMCTSMPLKYKSVIEKKA
jgi:hypothetical protein